MASGVRTDPPKRMPSRGTEVAAASVSMTPRDTASVAAQSTAMLACSEPSYPTTMPAPTIDLLLAQAPACATPVKHEGGRRARSPGRRSRVEDGAEGPESGFSGGGLP